MYQIIFKINKIGEDMIEFKVGDIIDICASIDKFCGTYQLYSVYNIGISKHPDACPITIGPGIGGCLPTSGVELEFKFVAFSTTLKSLGTSATDGSGIATKSYALTDTDADLFNHNDGFAVQACFTVTGPNYPNTTSSSYCRNTTDLIIRGTIIGNSCIMRQGTSACLNDQTIIVYENPIYTAGKIIDACIYRAGGSIELPEGKIKVFRLTGTTWSVIGESGFIPLQNDGITTFTGLNIIALKGDYIGLYVRPSPIHGYGACISARGSAGLYYTKSHSGDVTASTSNSEWQSLQQNGVAITATIIPCAGVICPDICGTPPDYNLYYRVCDPIQGCIRGTLKEANSPTCGYIHPTIIRYELYYKIADIIPAWFVSSVLSTIYNGAVNATSTLTGYYIESVEFDPNKYIVTITMTSYATVSGSSEIQNLAPSPISDSILYALASDITLLILFALGIVAAPVAAALALIISISVISYSIVTFLGKKESIGGQSPSTRVITLTAEICTGTTTNPCSTSNPITDPNMTVLINVVAGTDTQPPGNITATSPTATFSVPTNVDVSITAKVKDNPYYTMFTADPQSYPALKSCTPGDSCPTTVPIIIKLFAQADAKVAPKVADTSGNPLPGKYLLFIEDSRGVKVEDGSGDLVNGQVPQGIIPADKEYCVAIIPSDYPTHNMVFTCSSCSAGQICSPTLVSKTCTEQKNSVTIRCVYISASGARLGFTPDEIDITDMSTNTVKKILHGTPAEGSTCSGVITSNITCVDGLENNKTYKVHVISSTYTVATATQDQEVTYTTDCNTGIMLTVEASPPLNTFDITIQVQNDKTLTALPGAIVTLGTMPADTTGSDGSVMFASVPKGTGIPLKVTLTGYKDYSNKIDITASRTVTVQMSVNQVLQTVDTRISNFSTVGDVIATKSVKFKGDLEYLDVTTYRPLTDAPITVTVKDKDGATLQTLSATSQAGIGTIGAGYFETGEWLVPKGLVDTQISTTATFDGAGKYKSTTVSTTYVVAKVADCAIPIPFTNSCLLSKETGSALLMIGGVLIGGYLLYKVSGAIPKAKATMTEVREHITPPPRVEGEIVEIRPVRGSITV